MKTTKDGNILPDDDREISLKSMRGYLLDWYPHGITEQRNKIDPVYFEDYDKELIIRDAQTEEEIFRAIFHDYQKITADVPVYASGIRNQELRGIIIKSIDLDAQIEEYRKRDEQEAAAKAQAQPE